MSHAVRRPVVLPLVLAFTVALTPSCRRESHDSHDHASADHPAAPGIVQRTRANLGERYLVHLIHPDLVRGARASVLVHGTRLDQGTPIGGGDITLVARGPGGAELRFPTRELMPGHWPGDVELPAAGTWTLAIDVNSANGSEEVGLGAIEVHPDAASASRVPAPQAPAGAIPFLFEQQWPVAMRFERVGPRPLTEWLSVSGRVAPRPGGEAHIAAPVSGRLLAPKGGRLPRPGDRVSAGDVIGVVEPHLATSDIVGLQALEYQQHQLRHELDLQQLDAERVLGSARVRIQSGTRELERAERLVAQTLATQQELDRARADLELSRAEESAALASLASVNRLRNEHAEDPVVKAPLLPLIAPIAGIVAEIHAVLGESVESGAKLATILDLSSVWAIAEVPESELSRLGTIADARFRPLGTDERVEAESAPVHVASRVDATTRCVAVAFDVPNAGGRLRSGMLCTFELRLRDHADAISVSKSALAYEQGQPIVYVLVDCETFVKRRLELGLEDNGRVQVLEGLAPGDVIVATRADEVRLAALSSSGKIVEHHH
ncbi:MAG: efflux RND transporter periplasmic adaptor subunit [Planctomycetota bacterium]|nr:efflux RND transporter periplasmic adaptor subunit [Planctomycetota bacterium]